MSGKISQYTEALSVANDDFFDVSIDTGGGVYATRKVRKSNLGIGGSPLTTKGDLYTYDSADARLGVGADGQALIADSAEATGLRWGSITADNMATADLSLTGNRTHDLNGFDLTLYKGQTIIKGLGSTSATTALRVENSSGEVILRAINDNQVYSRGNGDISTNTAFGQSSGLALTGGNNTFYGYESGKSNNSGTGNSVFGASSFRLQTGGINNSAFGYQAMQNTTVANENCAFGRRALVQLSTGDNNTAIGSGAGDGIVGGGGNLNANYGVYVGSKTRPSASGNTNEIIIGYNAEGNGSNTATYGNTSITDHYFNGGLTVQTTTNAFTPPVMTSTQASAITASNGMMLYVTDTNATFTSVGFWGYENGSWVKL